MTEPKASSPYAFRINEEVLFDPEPRQFEAIQIAYSGKYSNLLVWGNRGGGKSITFRSFAHAWALKHPKSKYLIIRRSFPELQKTHLSFLPDEMKKIGGSFNKTEHIAYYPNGSLGFYAQCDNEADARKVLGAEAALIIFDEAPELEWEWMTLIGASLRVTVDSGIKPMVIYLGNPVGTSIPQLWSYFIDKDVDPNDDPEYNPDDWHAFELHLKDNKHVDPTVYQKRFAGLPLHVIKAWRDGERTYERALFQLKPTITVEEADESGELRAVKKPYHVIDALPTFEGQSILSQPWVQIYRAFDMGYHPDPAYCLWLAVFGKQIIAFREQIWFRTIAKDIAHQMKEITKDIIDGPRVIATYADPTIGIETGHDAVSIKDILEMNGIPIDLSINKRELYAHAINSALQTEVMPGVPKLRILKSGCPYLLKSIPKMSYDEKNPMRMADHKDDHPPISLAYFLISSGVLTETAPDTRAKRPAWMNEYMPKSPRFILGSEGVRKR